jgi:hypothetical protein
MLAAFIDQVAAENGDAPQSVERAREMAAFFRFLATRMPGLLDEWDQLRRSDHALEAPEPPSATSVMPS